MGIKNLKTLLNNYCNDYIITKNLKDYQGKILAVDTSIFIYKSLYNNSDILDGMTRVVLRFLKNGIIPVFIFDGKPPEQKQNILNQRKDRKNQQISKKEYIQGLINKKQSSKSAEEEDIIDQSTDLYQTMELSELQNELHKVNKSIIHINDKHFKQLYKLLELFGVPYFIANGEGEAFCAKLFLNGIVDGVISEDSDVLVNGGKTFIRGFNPDKNTVEEYNLDKILTSLEITFEQFIDLCILCGCDYTTKINGIGSITAFKLIKSYKNIENIVDWICKNKKYEIPEDFDYVKSRDLFNNSFKDFNYDEFDNQLKEPNIKNLIEFLQTNSDFLKEKYYYEISNSLFSYYENITIKNKKVQTSLFSYFSVIS